MVWVLWDILIPLLTSFALGTLLAWLIWRRRQNSHQGVALGVASTSEVTISDTMAFDTEPETGGAVSSADADELEAANIILIGERDKAALALENMREEANVMKQRIAELEASEREKNDQIKAAALKASANPKSVNPKLAPVDVALAAGVNVDKPVPDELQRARADLDSLSEILNKERKARRATELELLNTRNRHEKFVANNSAHISEEQHLREITDRDEQIDNLKQQLADRDVVEPQATDLIPNEEPTEELQEDTVKMSPVSKSAVAKNGYTPVGWSVQSDGHNGQEADKLTDIKGVGKVLQKKLHDCGIYFYHQVANLDESGIEELQAQIPQFPGRIERDRWVEQAKELQQKKALVEG